jgi:hypothetical protein
MPIVLREHQLGREPPYGPCDGYHHAFVQALDNNITREDGSRAALVRWTEGTPADFPTLQNTCS